MSKADEIDNKKAVNIIISFTIIFYEEPPKKDTWGSNNVAYQLFYNA